MVWCSWSRALVCVVCLCQSLWFFFMLGDCLSHFLVGHLMCDAVGSYCLMAEMLPLA